MEEDIRDKLSLSYQDILGLNFIRDPGMYLFRRHYKQGLRSHIMEVLDSGDVELESRGMVKEGIRWFPRARPRKMLRIFRTKFNNINEALQEIKTVKIIEGYLAPDHLALSNEFLVDYISHGRRDLILCGIQEYVEGEVLDPWRPMTGDSLLNLFSRMGAGQMDVSGYGVEQLLQKVQRSADNFIKRIKGMILDTDHIPDLAGVGNLILTPSGNIKLVDINNISKVTSKPEISIDDRGYPVCDKSIEALSLLEKNLLNSAINLGEKLYRTFLDPHRMEAVKSIVIKFYTSMQGGDCLPD